MVHDERPAGPNAVEVVLDDERTVGDAGVVLVATLADQLGIEALAAQFVRLVDRAGAANAGRRVMSLIYAMVLGADCIDDADILRSGSTRKLLGCRVAAPSTIGTFYARSRSGMCASSIGCWPSCSSVPGRPARARAPGGWSSMSIPFVGEVCGYAKQGASFGTRASAATTR